MNALELVGISKRFGKVQTLTDIDLALEKGEFLVLLGASGCGKSTLLNIVAGLLEPTSGTVRIAGRDMAGVAPKNRDIAMVFQSYALYPNLSVARNIGFGLEMRGTAKAEREAAVRKAAETLRIANLLDRRPADLSGGQRQRVAIGRALVRDPHLFLFDEPLSNLDAKLRMEMRAELKRLHQMLGATIVYVTHDQIEAMTLATRIAVMKGGAIEQIGRPEEIYNAPATRFVAEFVGSPAMNLLPATRDSASLRIDGTGIDLPVPPSLTGRRDLPTKIVLGIRPEDLRLADPGEVPRIEATIDLVELTGPEKIVFALLGDLHLTASLPPQAPVSTGSTAVFSFSEDGLHIFDAQTGTRL